MKEIKLSEWARSNNISYRNAWNSMQAGTLPVKTKTNTNGRIFALIDEPQIVKEKKSIEFAMPTLAGKEIMSASTRRNVSATSTPTDQYRNINNGITPASAFNRRGDGGNNSNSSVTEAIQLCQKHISIILFLEM